MASKWSKWLLLATVISTLGVAVAQTTTAAGSEDSLDPCVAHCYRDIIFDDGCTRSDVACHCSMQSALANAMLACIDSHNECSDANSTAYTDALSIGCHKYVKILSVAGSTTTSVVSTTLSPPTSCSTLASMLVHKSSRSIPTGPAKEAAENEVSAAQDGAGENPSSSTPDGRVSVLTSTAVRVITTSTATIISQGISSSELTAMPVEMTTTATDVIKIDCSCTETSGTTCTSTLADASPNTVKPDATSSVLTNFSSTGYPSSLGNTVVPTTPSQPAVSPSSIYSISPSVGSPLETYTNTSAVSPTKTWVATYTTSGPSGEQNTTGTQTGPAATGDSPTTETKSESYGSQGTAGPITTAASPATYTVVGTPGSPVTTTVETVPIDSTTAAAATYTISGPSGPQVSTSTNTGLAASTATFATYTISGSEGSLITTTLYTIAPISSTSTTAAYTSSTPGGLSETTAIYTLSTTSAVPTLATYTISGPSAAITTVAVGTLPGGPSTMTTYAASQSSGPAASTGISPTPIFSYPTSYAPSGAIGSGTVPGAGGNSPGTYPQGTPPIYSHSTSTLTTTVDSADSTLVLTTVLTYSALHPTAGASQPSAGQGSVSITLISSLPFSEYPTASLQSPSASAGEVTGTSTAPSGAHNSMGESSVLVPASGAGYPPGTGGMGPSASGQSPLPSTGGVTGTSAAPSGAHNSMDESSVSVPASGSGHPLGTAGTGLSASVPVPASGSEYPLGTAGTGSSASDQTPSVPAITSIAVTSYIIGVSTNPEGLTTSYSSPITSYSVLVTSLAPVPDSGALNTPSGSGLGSETGSVAIISGSTIHVPPPPSQAATNTIPPYANQSTVLSSATPEASTSIPVGGGASPSEGTPLASVITPSISGSPSASIAGETVTTIGPNTPTLSALATQTGPSGNTYTVGQGPGGSIYTIGQGSDSNTYSTETASPLAGNTDSPTNGSPNNGSPTNGSPNNGSPTNGSPNNGSPTNGSPATPSSPNPAVTGSSSQNAGVYPTGVAGVSGGNSAPGGSGSSVPSTGPAAASNAVSTLPNPTVAVGGAMAIQPLLTKTAYTLLVLVLLF